MHWKLDFLSQNCYKTWLKWDNRGIFSFLYFSKRLNTTNDSTLYYSYVTNRALWTSCSVVWVVASEQTLVEVRPLLQQLFPNASLSSSLSDRTCIGSLAGYLNYHVFCLLQHRNLMPLTSTISTFNNNFTGLFIPFL